MTPWNRLNPAELLLHDASLSLSEEAFGVLMRLSLRALAGVPIPDDEAACRRAAGTRCRDWPATWQEVRSVLVPVESDGIHRNPRTLSWDWIDSLRADTEARLSSDRNRKKQSIQGTAKADPPLDSNGFHRNPSDSALRTDGRTDKRTNEQEHASRAAVAPAPAPTQASPKARKQPSGDHAALIAWWTERFLAETGKPYAFQAGKDGAAVKAILRACGAAGLQEAQERAGRFFADDWHRERGLTLGAFYGAWNRLTGTAPSKPAPPPPPPVDDARAIRAKIDARARELSAQRASAGGAA